MDIIINEYAEKASINYGRIVTFEMPMEAYPDKRMRTIRVWLPEGYNEKRLYPALYMHDAQNLFDSSDDLGKWYVNREMESLEKEGLSAIIVGVDNSQMRMSELCPEVPINPSMFSMLGIPYEKISPTGNLYAEFITNQLKPFIDEKFLTLPDAANTAIGGASMGGLISLYMLLKYPNVYSKGMVFAPNFVAHGEHELLGRLKAYDYSKLTDNRIFIFHGGLTIDAVNWPYARRVYETMIEQGMDETSLALLYDSRQPHNESAWRKYFAEAFRYLFANK